MSTVPVTVTGTAASGKSASTLSWLRKPKFAVPLCTPAVPVFSANVTVPLAPAARLAGRLSVIVPV